jgi:hypothetical protein
MQDIGADHRGFIDSLNIDGDAMGSDPINRV